jgi:hypothetical protein
VRAPLVEAEQHGSIRIQNLTKVVMGGNRSWLTEQRLVPFEAAGNVTYADDRPCAFHRISADGLTTQHFENQRVHHRELTTRCWVRSSAWLGDRRALLPSVEWRGWAPSCERDAKTQARLAAELLRFDEVLDEDASIRFDDAL